MLIYRIPGTTTTYLLKSNITATVFNTTRRVATKIGNGITKTSGIRKEIRASATAAVVLTLCEKVLSNHRPLNTRKSQEFYTKNKSCLS